MTKFYRLLYSKTPKIKDKDGNIKSTSITSLEKVVLGGIKQSILIRGHDINNPLLLHLHGGPGGAKIGYNRIYQKNLEEKFTIINWDQRGCGKTYSPLTSRKSMNLEQFLSDTLELIEILKKRFNKEKIYLEGHSWGTIIGMKLVQKYPELFYAFIAIGQVADMNESEKRSLNFTLEAARKAGNEIDTQILEKMKAPFTNIFKLKKQRSLLNKYKGGIFHSKYIGNGKYMKESYEYNLLDLIKIQLGLLFSIRTMWTSLARINFIKEIPEVEVPVYFMTGRYDYQVNASLAEDYFKILKAPKKMLVWFEKSAHAPNWEENEKFDDVLISQILPETYEK
ncbi:MAG: alpha/beta hydrolase [archaeon]|nr:alpha/beta hydrolase [archaeon]